MSPDRESGGRQCCKQRPRWKLGWFLRKLWCRASRERSAFCRLWKTFRCLSLSQLWSLPCLYRYRATSFHSSSQLNDFELDFETLSQREHWNQCLWLSYLTSQFCKDLLSELFDRDALSSGTLFADEPHDANLSLDVLDVSGAHREIRWPSLSVSPQKWKASLVSTVHSSLKSYHDHHKAALLMVAIPQTHLSSRLLARK